MTEQMNLSKEQKAIIEHTIKNGIFCGGGKDMQLLCDAGLMEYIGQKSFVPDPYYRVTSGLYPRGCLTIRKVRRSCISRRKAHGQCPIF